MEQVTIDSIKELEIDDLMALRKHYGEMVKNQSCPEEALPNLVRAVNAIEDIIILKRILGED